jgi:4-alpha-glucanotransferase
VDPNKRRHEAHPESVLLALHALGAPVASGRDVPSALAEKRATLARRSVEPVIVAWDGRLQPKDARLPSNSKPTLILEDGRAAAWPPRTPLPHGYHQLRVWSKGSGTETLLISAPTRAHFPLTGKTWGVFAPVYALHSKRTFGAGDLSDLESLIDWTAERGGGVVSTLPLLANFLEEPFEPSPYSPISRLFWNEFYIDLARVPELSLSQEARRLLESDPPARTKLVDYRRTMQEKRRILEAMARTFFESGVEERRRDFALFLANNPEAREYAWFRARTDRERRGWHAWRNEVSASEAAGEQYHLYVQWVIQNQLRDLALRTRSAGCLLYLDLPLGLHAESFDTWRYPNLFVKGMSGGAPPDPVFTTGQNWAFQPIHPQAMREDGYRYAIAYLRNHLRYANLLRIDHVMGLHRLYWIPEGLTGDRGLYVRYPAAEMYAILSLESHRANAGIVGENLGVVPSEVNQSMAKHNVKRLYVAQYETAVDSGKKALRNPPADSVASLNTHDMFPFRAFIDGKDIDARLKLGFLTASEARIEKEDRRRVRKGFEKAFGKDIFQGCVRFLEESRAGIVLHNLEDLWGETRPQNIPSTTTEHANWRRRMRYSMERLRRLKTMFSR